MLISGKGALGTMNKQVYFYFDRPDFHTAAREMLHLYLPDVEPVMLNVEQLREWLDQPEPDCLVLEGTVEGVDRAVHCKVRVHALMDGKLNSFQQECSIDMLAWENRLGVERRGIRLLVNRMLAEYFAVHKSPWGILRGIRPSRIVHRLLDERCPAQEIKALLQREYDVATEKANLLTDIAVSQRPFLLTAEQASRIVSIYIGIPFCPSRCLYCSFPSFPIAGAGRKVDKFLEALRHEIAVVQQFLLDRQISVQTIYIGGGTPTSLPDPLFKQLLEDVTQAFTSSGLEEFTVEAGRPDTITPEKLSILREYGASRISINPQSMREQTLKNIGRSHRPEDVEAVFALARQYGFVNINMDIIAGLPGEGPADMAYTLERITALKPENLTVHTLAVKRGSTLKETSGFHRTEADVVREMLELSRQTAQTMGMKPYYLYRQKNMAGNMENIGYALPGKECLYNIQIMEERQTIIGLGAYAGTKAVCPGTWQLQSCYNPKDVPTYLNEYQGYLERKLALLDRVLRNKEELLC